MPAKQRKIAIMGYRSVGKLNNALLINPNYVALRRSIF